MNSNSTQQSEQFYSAKSQISQQSMSTTFDEALENICDRDKYNSDTTIIETLQTINILEEARKTVVEMGKTDQPQTVQVSHEDPKEKVIKMFSDQTEANMLKYILNTK